MCSGLRPTITALASLRNGGRKTFSNLGGERTNEETTANELIEIELSEIREEQTIVFVEIRNRVFTAAVHETPTNAARCTGIVDIPLKG